MNDTQQPVHLNIERALEMIGDPVMVLKILGMAQTALRRDTERLPALLAAGDLAAAAGVLHTLKGMLPLFCGDSLVQQVSACERAAKAGGAADGLPLCPEVGAQLKTLLAEIDAYLAGLPPVPLQ